ncbi:serine/threonine-protein kinase [Rhodococcus daqingensis]|uniref:non-specific serine/threonine protein kinase n=1 Tax=Rhodococcus daqingensis TaxID=2479363 RepID=A0ABW2S1Q8_9NOCA
MNPRAATEPAPLNAGSQLIPGFRVRRHLRRATPFDVYEVISQERRCSCIAKMPRPELIHSERARKMLRAEADHLLSFSHPHLVRAYEFVDEPQPALIMETLTGQTLKHLIHESGHALTAQELAIMGTHLTSALGYLHDKRLVHLDLKPSNVVCEAGKVKLIDLSLAREPGTVHRGIGTRTYLSPEQAAGGELTTAADIWGIGAVMYEAVTRATPFPDSTPQAYQQVSTRLRLPKSCRVELPSDLASTINDCLEPTAADRPSLIEVESVLERFI